MRNEGRRVRSLAAACATAVAGAALFASSAASADGGIGIQPVSVHIDAAHHIASMMIANYDPGLHTFQITPYSWSQVDGQDKLTPTTDLLVSPPIFTLVSEGQQVVRFALRNAAPVAAEQTFRITLRAVPSDTVPLDSGVRLRLSFSLPVFIASPQGGVPKLACGYRDVGHNRVRLSIENSGSAHVHVIHVQLADARGIAVDAPAAQYVLAGGRTTMNLPSSRPMADKTIDAKFTFDQGLGPPMSVVVHRDD